MTKALEKIFSLKNDKDKKHKVVTICGLKMKFKKNINNKNFKIPDLKGKIEHYQLMHDKSLDVGIPNNLVLQLCFNNDCNCKCSFCTIYHQQGLERRTINPDIIYKQLLPLYPKTATIFPTYGEITHRIEGYNYLSFINKNYHHINIHVESNGIAFDEKWRKLALDNLMSINFSVNGIDEKSYRKTVWDKEGIFTRATNNIKQYIEDLEANNLAEFRPSFSCVLNSTNYQNVLQFVKNALELKIWKIYFYFDCRENSVSKLTVKDQEHFDNALMTLLELEKLLWNKVRIGFRLYIPVKNLSDYEKKIEKVDIETLKQKYSDIWEIAKDFDTYRFWQIKTQKRKEHGKFQYNYYIEMASNCYNQKDYNGTMICENPDTHIRIREDGRLGVCSLIGYRDTYNIYNFMENGQINWYKLFNDEYRRKLRRNFRNGDYSGCMKNCMASRPIKTEDFKKMYNNSYDY